MSRIANRLVPLSLLVGLIVATVALWLTGVLGEAWESLRGAYIPPLVLTVVVGMATPVVHAWRWKVVLKSVDVELSMSRAADITVSSALLNYSSPGFIGASAKAVLARRTSGVDFNKSALSIALEHSLDLTLMFGTAVLAAVLLGPSRFIAAAAGFNITTLLIAAAIGVAALVVILLIGWRFGLVTYIRDTWHTARILFLEVDRSRVALLTLLYWFLQVLVVALLFWALNIPFELINILAVATVPGLAAMVSPIPGGVGVREAVTVALTAVTTIAASSLISLALLQRVLLVGALPLSLGALRLFRWLEGRRGWLTR